MIADREPIRVVLVDNWELFEEGLAKVLESQSNILVIYQCNDSIKQGGEHRGSWS
jgi:hypothetical protein